LTDRLAVGPLQVSPICIGRVADDRVIDAALEAGINFFFISADMHWPLYQNSRRGMDRFLLRRQHRDEVVVAGVSYVTQPEFCDLPFAELLEAQPRLGRLDLLIAGGAYGHEIQRRLTLYRKHRQQARHGARAIGASFHDRIACADCIDRGDVDVAFTRYNAAHPNARTDLFPRSSCGRVPLFTFKSTGGWVTPERVAALGLSGDFWIPTITDHYRFALSRPEVSGLLVHLGTPAHVHELADALDAGPLTADEEEHLIYLAGLDAGNYALTSG
jgi:predicted aldo/keto reductase-like oxidoreductase